MTLRLFHHDDPVERETERLLPWYLNGSLQAAERARVEAHIAQCARCRREAAWLRELQAAVETEQPADEVAAALAQANRLIDQLESGARWRRGAARLLRGFRSAEPWLRWTVAGEAALIVLFALMLAGEPNEPALYRTLAAPTAERGAGAALSVVFDDAARADDLRRVLGAAGARIVGGPSANGAYTVEVGATQLEHTIARLRAERAVRAVERVPEAPR